MSKFKTFLLLTVFAALPLLFSARAKAAVSPISVNLLPPVQFPPEDFNVAGLRASILWGDQRSVYGFDFGVLGNMSDINFVGLGVSGVFNMNKGTATILGLQAAGVANINVNKTNVYGLQLALGVNANSAASSVIGVQAAVLANLSSFTDIYGLQVGLFNKAQSVYGFQFGLINMANSLHGVQIGLLNFNKTGLFAVSPILNIGF